MHCRNKTSNLSSSLNPSLGYLPNTPVRQSSSISSNYPPDSSHAALLLPHGHSEPLFRPSDSISQLHSLGDKSFEDPLRPRFSEGLDDFDDEDDIVLPDIQDTVQCPSVGLVGSNRSKPWRQCNSMGMDSSLLDHNRTSDNNGFPHNSRHSYHSLDTDSPICSSNSPRLPSLHGDTTFPQSTTRLSAASSSSTSYFATFNSFDELAGGDNLYGDQRSPSHLSSDAYAPEHVTARSLDQQANTRGRIGMNNTGTTSGFNSLPYSYSCSHSVPLRHWRCSDPH